MYQKIIQLLEQHHANMTPEVLTLAAQLSECAAADDDISLILEWVEQKRKAYTVDTTEIPIPQLEQWSVHPQTGHISHKSGKFFSIIGVKVAGAAGREVSSWAQPMIKQNECGILGILCKNFADTRKYLLYLKYEPGNMHKLQLSPTLQATASNLKQAHGGKKPLFAEYFEEGGRGKVLVNAEGVEDGGRFYLKTNRCMVVEVDEQEQLQIPDDFIWLTLPQIKKLAKMDLMVNSLTRTVLGSL